MRVLIEKSYRDLQLERAVSKGEVLTVNEERAEELVRLGIATDYDAGGEEKATKSEYDTSAPLRTEEGFAGQKTGEHTREALEQMPYSDLQNLAKELQIKANQRAKKLIEEILKHK